MCLVSLRRASMSTKLVPSQRQKGSTANDTMSCMYLCDGYPSATRRHPTVLYYPLYFTPIWLVSAKTSCSINKKIKI